MYFSSVSRQRTHIAKNEKYLGSVNSYNNFFTKFISHLFRLAVDVEVGGKKRRLNKKSYVKFLAHLRVEKSKENLPKSLEKLALSIPRERRLMRNYLSASKVERLTKRLLHALARGNSEMAFHLAGKGADINRHFWDRGCYGMGLGGQKEGLPLRAIKADFTLHTPFSYTSLHTMPHTFHLIKKLGGDRGFQGDIVQFQRKIDNTQVDRTYHVNTVPVHHGYYRTHYGRVVPIVTHQPYVSSDVKVNTFFTDKVTLKGHIVWDEDREGFRKVYLARPTMVENTPQRHVEYA